jgi:hypothetical protein
MAAPAFSIVDLQPVAIIAGSPSPTTPTTAVNASGPYGDNQHLASEFKMTVISVTSNAGGTLFTYTLLEEHEQTTGTFLVTVTGLSPAAYNVTNVTATRTGAKTFTVVGPGSNPGAATLNGDEYAIRYPNAGSRFTTIPPLVTDTRRWDVFSGDLAFPYDGKDGYVYGFLGDTFGSDWNGPNTTHGYTGNSTIRSAANGKVLSSFNGQVGDTIELQTTGSFLTTGGYAVVQLSSDSNHLAYLKYRSRSGTGTSTVLNDVELVYAPDSTKTLTTGDTIRGDDGWTDAGWRSNTHWRSSTTDLSSGYAIDTFKNLSSQSYARQAIPGRHDTEAESNVYGQSRTITAISVSGGIATVTVNARHKLVPGQPVTIAGVTDTGFNGSYTVKSTGMTTVQFQYDLSKANSSSSGGTAIGSAPISSATCVSFAVTVNTSVPHGLIAGQDVKIASHPNITDGFYMVATVPSATQYTIGAFVADFTGVAGGTSQPAANNYALLGDHTTVSGPLEGSIIPSGAIAVEGQAAFASGVIGQITNATWAAGVATLTVSASANLWEVGEKITVSGMNPSGYNVTLATVTAKTSTTVSYALASNPGAFVNANVAQALGTRHVAFYWDVTWFGGATGWYSNYLGIAYSDNKGDTWTRVGVSGASYQTIDASAVWMQNTSWTEKFSQAWPFEHPTDGKIYFMCGQNGRLGGAYMMRVTKANILVKSSYEYWNGTTWTSTQSAAAQIFTQDTFSPAVAVHPVGEPSMIYHAPSAKYISSYLDAFIGGIVFRTADAPEGPWSQKSSLLLGSQFGDADMYGGWIHPLSGISPNAASTFYFHISLWAPYLTVLMRGTILGSDDQGTFVETEVIGVIDGDTGDLLDLEAMLGLIDDDTGTGAEDASVAFTDDDTGTGTEDAWLDLSDDELGTFLEDALLDLSSEDVAEFFDDMVVGLTDDDTGVGVEDIEPYFILDGDTAVGIEEESIHELVGILKGPAKRIAFSSLTRVSLERSRNADHISTSKDPSVTLRPSE